MKPTTFKNRLNGELVVCEDTKKLIQIIDGVEYLVVHRTNNNRHFLMRKDALEVMKDKKVKT